MSNPMADKIAGILEEHGMVMARRTVDAKFVAFQYVDEDGEAWVSVQEVTSDE